MNKTFKCLLSLVLVLSLILTSTISAFAIDGEVYISDLRIIYAEDYSEACDILDEGEFYEYEILDENLNEDTGETGVFLAYKTTEDIEDAITDIAVMQMQGGYEEGNYQEMIRQSYDEYVEMGGIYEDAIDYFINAYKAGDLFAKTAYRQLNFYTANDSDMGYDGDRLGDIFSHGVSKHELATMFMEGNSYALKNIRSLISMGVSYNADGETYFDKVAAEAEKYAADTTPFEENDDYYYELAILIEPSITSFRKMFEMLETCESELNYDDDTVTELEIKFLEYAALAKAMRKVDYLNDMSLYDFCLQFPPIAHYEDMKTLYPLAAALNEGQRAMTNVAHYYDVVRYGICVGTEEFINDKLSEMEDKYSEYPFDLYTGVDRDIFNGTFALTSDAARADAYTESGLCEFIMNNGLAVSGVVVGGLGVSVMAGGIFTMVEASTTLTEKLLAISNAFDQHTMNAVNNLSGHEFLLVGSDPTSAMTFEEAINDILLNNANLDADTLASMSFYDKYNLIPTDASGPVSTVQWNSLPTSEELYAFEQMNIAVADAKSQVVATHDQATTTATQNAALQSNLGAAICIVGGAMMIYSAVTLGITIYNYYHPDYDDIPTAMVDLVDTLDGDRYIKYDVVYEAEAQKDGSYAAGDLNAFEANRWIALYYTKSYEAGTPLLADFEISNRNNVPKAGFAPVRRFGEVICYNLNNYNFDYDTDIYLSVAQSEYQKSAVADVPELIGSVFSTGWALLAGGVGLLAGIGGTIGTQKLFRKKKQGTSNTSEA